MAKELYSFQSVQEARRRRQDMAFYGNYPLGMAARAGVVMRPPQKKVPVQPNVDNMPEGSNQQAGSDTETVLLPESDTSAMARPVGEVILNHIPDAENSVTT